MGMIKKVSEIVSFNNSIFLPSLHFIIETLYTYIFLNKSKMQRDLLLIQQLGKSTIHYLCQNLAIK